ncbi:MAG: PssE/Cps14G family polysaccharide biosynthesis glycosyltransferase [Acutalibacteraceae bacterium]|nr:PssE/Cps14G family polysaccharide biosynthesis glycosyltransferase [Acutalibacteraceae bacterium]
MIFVVVGTQKFQLNRLLKEIDSQIEKGIIKEEVFAQIGNSDYKPKYYKFKKFIDKDEFEKIMEECTILITHSGVGTIISGLNHNKPVIVYPRLKKYNEHVDDHQTEIAKSFSEMNYVLLCNEDDDLSNLLKEASKHKFEKYSSRRVDTIKAINKFLDSF